MRNIGMGATCERAPLAARPHTKQTDVNHVQPAGANDPVHSTCLRGGMPAQRLCAVRAILPDLSVGVASAHSHWLASVGVTGGNPCGSNRRLMMKLGAEHRRALKLLAEAGPNGCAEALLINAHDFSRTILSALIGAGLVRPQSEPMRAGRRTVDVVRLRITDAGR